MAKRMTLSELEHYQEELLRLRLGSDYKELKFKAGEDMKGTVNFAFAQEQMRNAFIAARNIPEEHGYAMLLNLLEKYPDERSLHIMLNSMMAAFYLLNGRTDSKVTEKDIQNLSKQSKGANLLLPTLRHSLKGEADIFYDLSRAEFLIEFSAKAVKEKDERLRKNPAENRLCNEALRRVREKRKERLPRN